MLTSASGLSSSESMSPAAPTPTAAPTAAPTPTERATPTAIKHFRLDLGLLLGATCKLSFSIQICHNGQKSKRTMLELQRSLPNPKAKFPKCVCHCLYHSKKAYEITSTNEDRQCKLKRD